MNNQGLLALAQLILPSEILTNFEVVHVEEEASLIRIYLDESVRLNIKKALRSNPKGSVKPRNRRMRNRMYGGVRGR